MYSERPYHRTKTNSGKTSVELGHQLQERAGKIKETARLILTPKFGKRGATFRKQLREFRSGTSLAQARQMAVN